MFILKNVTPHMISIWSNIGSTKMSSDRSNLGGTKCAAQVQNKAGLPPASTSLNRGWIAVSKLMFKQRLDSYKRTEVEIEALFYVQAG